MRSFDNKAKTAVVLVATACWLIVVVVRGQFLGEATNLDASWLMGLATLLQQGSISGRDFHFTYGPATQLIAWLATSVTVTQSAFDAYRMLSVFFTGVCALLMSAILLLLDRISWKQTIVVYCLAAFLNLNWGIPNFRTTLLLLCVVLSYRMLAATTFPRQLAWAVATGLACFVSQLVTLDIGLFGSIVALGTLASSYLIQREARTLKLAGVFLSTFILLNLSISVLFKLTSVQYSALFGYQRYAFETVTAYTNTMGLRWQLDRESTLFLALLGLYTLAAAAIAAYRSKPVDRALLVGFVIAALISMKSAFVRSDGGHVLFGAGPLIFTFLMLGKKEWNSRVGQILWCVFVLGLLFVWPRGSWGVPRDLLKGIDGEVPLASAIEKMSSDTAPLEYILPPTLLTPEFRNRPAVPILPFPYHNYIPIALHRPLFAPVLQSFQGATEALQEFYVDALERQRPAGLDVVYSLDSVAVWPIDGIPIITRVPRIFEYLYTHFQLASIGEQKEGHYILHPRENAKRPLAQGLEFTATRSDDGSGSLSLKQPSTCGLIRLELTATYSPARLLLRPAGVELVFKKGSQPILGTFARPAYLNKPFTTYVSLMEPAAFYQLFGESVIWSKAWDNLEYRPEKTDVLGTAPQKVEMTRLECVDPQRFLEAPADETLFPELMTGTSKEGYVVLTPDSKQVPELTARLAYSGVGGRRLYAYLTGKPANTVYATSVDSLPSNNIGFALANPGQVEIQVQVTYDDGHGVRLASLKIPPGHRTTKLLAELLPSIPQTLAGTIEIRGRSRFSAIGVRFVDDRFDELAMNDSLTSDTGDQNSVLVPRFVMYGGWSTSLILANRKNDSATGIVKIFSASGRPMPITLNGVTSSEFRYSVPPSQTFVFSPTALR